MKQFVPLQQRVGFVLLALLLLSPVAVAQPPTNFNPRKTPPIPAPSLVELIHEYEADAQGVGNFYHLPWSETRFERLETLYKNWQTRLALVDFDALDAGGKVDYVLLRNEIESSLTQIVRNRKRLADMEPLVKFRAAIQELERARWKGEKVDGQTAATKIGEITKQVKQIRERVEKGRKSEAQGKTGADAPLPVSPSLALRAAGAVGELRETLARWYGFYNGFQPDFSWWMKTPFDEANKTLEEYAKFLREEIGNQRGKDEDPLIGDPIGAVALAEDIRYEFLPYTAEELIAIGERELAWCEGEMKAAAREMGCGDDWKAALAKVKADFVPPGQQDELVASIAHEAIAFTKEKRFATVPPLCEETWRLAMMSADAVKTVPYAAYSGQHMMVAYASEPMKQEDKLMVMRGNNRHFTRLTVAHELIPGHHLQQFQGARDHQYRRLFGTPFYVEGWALYCELRFWELGWAKTPQDRIGMLFWRMTRAARIIVSLNFHLNRMKPDEMVDFLVNRVGHEKLGATSEVRRFIGGGFSPLYQAGYLLGGTQLHTLHDEMVRDGKMTEQQFNDTVLMSGTIPIELLRAEMRQLPLTRDAKPSWKFAGEKPSEK